MKSFSFSMLKALCIIKNLFNIPFVLKASFYVCLKDCHALQFHGSSYDSTIFINISNKINMYICMSYDYNLSFSQSECHTLGTSWKTRFWSTHSILHLLTFAICRLRNIQQGNGSICHTLYRFEHHNHTKSVLRSPYQLRTMIGISNSDRL